MWKGLYVTGRVGCCRPYPQHHLNINKLKPDIKGLKSIHYAKKVFGQSKLVATNKEKY